MSKPIFEEQQQFRQWWIWIILAVVAGSIIYSYTQADNPTISDSLFSIVIFGLVLLLLFTAKLNTRIDEQGIHVKFFPFHFSYQRYTWDDINHAKVTNYSPLADYGGYGVRISFRGKGKAFNVSGNQGIWLETFSGKKRMIGTKKADEAEPIIKQYLKNS